MSSEKNLRDAVSSDSALAFRHRSGLPQTRQLFPQQRKSLLMTLTGEMCKKPTMIDADDLPPKRRECLTRPARRRGYLVVISSPGGAVLSRRSMASADREMGRLESSEPQVLTA